MKDCGLCAPEFLQELVHRSRPPDFLTREDPKAWFRLCDADGDRKLSRDEVVSALKAQLPLDNKAIDKFRTDDAAWRMWDSDQKPS